jgi:hypothetical protein
MKTLHIDIDQFGFVEREKSDSKSITNRCGRDFVYYGLHYYFPTKFNPQNLNPVAIENSVLTEGKQVINIFQYALTQAANIFWIMALILVIYSAYLYLTSGGDKTAVTTARNYLMYAIIAMAVAIVSYGLPQFVKSVLESAVK